MTNPSAENYNNYGTKNGESNTKVLIVGSAVVALVAGAGYAGIAQANGNSSCFGSVQMEVSAGELSTNVFNNAQSRVEATDGENVNRHSVIEYIYKTNGQGVWYENTIKDGVAYINIPESCKD